MRRVLITGGAGFIGGHLAGELLRAGYEVRVLDNLLPEVHGAERRRPDALDPQVELQVGDVRDAQAVERALSGVDAVCHLAARVGVGQSMYQIAEYTSVNAFGTAVLLDRIARRPVERLIVASCMSVYGEGHYHDAQGRLVHPLERTYEQLQAGLWEPRTLAGELLTPIATTERRLPGVASIYALSKWDQERLCLLTARTYGFPCVALRLFNVYGPHQALSNPHAGVLASFAARLLERKPPLVFEDGQQRRDFVSVHDVARAFRLALESEEVDGEPINIGSGRASAVLEVAHQLAAALSVTDIDPVVTGRYRMGDIRHSHADVSTARVLLGYRPEVTLEAGLRELAEWLPGQLAASRTEAREGPLAGGGTP